LVSSESSIGGLYSGASDLGPSGHEAELMDLLPFTEIFGYYPTEIMVASGAFDPGIKGGSGSLVIFVNKDNPITKLTIKQLDGIFGAERTGGLQGVVLSPEYGRSAKDNIRKWGQIGLTCEWADKTINTYGYVFTGMKWFFQMKVFNGGDKWNPNYREYVETESAMVDREHPQGRTLTISQMLADLSKDKYGIAYCPLHYARNFPQVKPLAIAPKEGGPYIEPTRESFQNRTYPLTRSVFIYLNRAPSQPVDPKLKEFLRYILSREGQQEVVKYGRYLPLPAEVIREQLKKLD
jgi:phosphate transport system substrate-binding protein